MLKPKEATVLRLRYGLDRRGEHSLRETADLLHLTYQRIKRYRSVLGYRLVDKKL